MIEETLNKIESAIRRFKTTDNAQKEEVVRLLSALKSEVHQLTKTHIEQADSIAGFASVAAHEATRRNKSQHLLDLSLKGFADSVKEFELSHPKLVETVDQICRLLSGIGI